MSTQFIALENVRVARPCRADWDKMKGDDQSRFCGSCAKNVYNLSSMTRSDAEILIREKEGKLCVRFYQREDGTILTSDCSVGITPPRKMKFSMAMMTMFLAPILAVGGAMATTTIDKAAAMNTLRDTPIIGAILSRFSPPPISVMAGGMSYVPIAGKPSVAPPVAPPAVAPMMLGEISAPICTPTSAPPTSKQSDSDA